MALNCLRSVCVCVSVCACLYVRVCERGRLSSLFFFLVSVYLFPHRIELPEKNNDCYPLNACNNKANHSATHDKRAIQLENQI